MTGMRPMVIATLLLSLVFVTELHKCCGQIHYKNPGWGPGGKRSSHTSSSNILRKRHWHVDSLPFEADSKHRQRNLIALQQIAKSLAKKLVLPALSGGDESREKYTLKQWRGDQPAKIHHDDRN